MTVWPAVCECGRGVAGAMISDGRPWYMCGTIAGRPCMALDPYPIVDPDPLPFATENIVIPTVGELAAVGALCELAWKSITEDFASVVPPRYDDEGTLVR